MTIAESVQTQTSSSTSYEHMLQKGMAVACFLFPLLFLVSAIYFITGAREFIGDPVYQWVSNHDVEQYRFSQWAWMAMIPAMIGITRLLGYKKPSLAFWGAVFAFVGGVFQVSNDGIERRLSQLRQVDLDVFWNTGGIAPSPLDFIGLLILLWIIGMVMLGIACWRTGVLPKWVSGLIAFGPLAFFIYQGPGAVIPALPPIAYLVAAVCFLLAFPVVGTELWRRETAGKSSSWTGG